MARKKIKFKITFDNEEFFPTKSTLENKELIQAFISGELPIIKIWSDEEYFTGLHRDTSYLNSIRLRLLSNGSHSFSHNLSNGSTYTASFNNFIEFSTLSFTFSENGIRVTGTITVAMSILQEMMDDVTNSGLLYLESCEFSAKNHSDNLVFTKYGHNWELERQEEELYTEGHSVDFISGRPKIEIVK